MENRRNFTYLIPIAMAGFMALGLYLGSALTPRPEVPMSQGETDFQKIQDIIQILDERVLLMALYAEVWVMRGGKINC